jgi:hypothetical protein
VCGNDDRRLRRRSESCGLQVAVGRDREPSLNSCSASADRVAEGVLSALTNDCRIAPLRQVVNRRWGESVLVGSCWAVNVVWVYAALMDWLDRIVFDPQVRSGKPCVRGTRISVGDVLSSGRRDERRSDPSRFPAADTRRPPRLSGLRGRTRAQNGRYSSGIDVPVFLDEESSESLLHQLHDLGQTVRTFVDSASAAQRRRSCGRALSIVGAVVPHYDLTFQSDSHALQRLQEPRESTQSEQVRFRKGVRIEVHHVIAD